MLSSRDPIVRHMSCYLRHLKPVLDSAGIEVTPENSKRVDEAIHGIARIRYKDCSRTWKEVKKRIESDQEGFIKELKERL